MGKARDNGFTIVEILIVVVVIAILAAIVTVAYTGINNRAKTAKAKMYAAGVEKVAKAYFALNGVYPTSISHFASSDVALPSGASVLLDAGTLGPSNGENNVVYKYILSGSTATGGCVYYWSFTPPEGSLSWDGAPAPGQPGRSEPAYLGTADHSNCSASTLKGYAPAS